MDSIEPQHLRNPGAQASRVATIREPGATGETPDAPAPVPAGSATMLWLVRDSPYIVMLLLALAGVVLRMPVIYWVILMPVFGGISIGEGWRHYAAGADRLRLVYGVALNWCALLLAVYLLYNGGVAGVMNANATSLAMMTLLALGTFTAGVHARAWRMCAVGGLLFLTVPGLGWLDQSPLLIVAVIVAIAALGGATWWLTQWRSGAAVPSGSVSR